MFAYIKGVFEEKGNNYVVIDVGGIGYKIFMSNNCGEFIVLEETDNSNYKSKGKRVNIKFLFFIWYSDFINF